MPSITGQPAVDVAIGLFFAFFLLSILCSAINEAIATRLAWRSDTLLAALRSMLADSSAKPDRTKQPKDQATNPAAKASTSAATSGDQELITRLLDHPLIRSLVNETSRNELRRAVPSYIPSRTFALALIDTLTDKKDASDDAFVQAQKTIDGLDNAQLKQALSALLDDARGSINRYHEGIARWFDATMERASGWYKRRAQRNLWIIAIVVTIAFNADAGQIATALWKDPVLRASVVAQAQKAVDNGNTSDIKNPNPEAVKDQATLTTDIDRIRQLKLPLGWSVNTSDPRWPDDAIGWLAKLLGLAATVVALSLGSPFWFDLLGKVSRLRGTGAQPEPVGADRQVIVAQLQTESASGSGATPPAAPPGPPPQAP
jgi:hypothetical protein